MYFQETFMSSLPTKINCSEVQMSLTVDKMWQKQELQVRFKSASRVSLAPSAVMALLLCQQKYRPCCAANLNHEHWFDLVRSKRGWGSEKERNRALCLWETRNGGCVPEGNSVPTKQGCEALVSNSWVLLRQNNNISTAKWSSKTWFALNSGWSVCEWNDLLFLPYRLWYQQDPGT